ncbi:MAG: DUF502 domain-containing protein [bacterium]
MREILKTYFMRGLLIFLPVLLSIYLIIALLVMVENFFGEILLFLFPDALYFTGLGTIVSIIVIVGLGFFFGFSFTKRLHRLIEYPFRKIPLLKTLYSSFADILKYFSGESIKDKGKVVILRKPNEDYAMVGFLTQSNPELLPDKLRDSGKVAVYLPTSYQIGGFTVFVPLDWIEEVDMDFETALKGVFTGWIFEKDKED